MRSPEESCKHLGRDAWLFRKSRCFSNIDALSLEGNQGGGGNGVGSWRGEQRAGAGEGEST